MDPGKETQEGFDGGDSRGLNQLKCFGQKGYLKCTAKCAMVGDYFLCFEVFLRRLKPF